MNGSPAPGSAQEPHGKGSVCLGTGGACQHALELWPLPLSFPPVFWPSKACSSPYSRVSVLVPAHMLLRRPSVSMSLTLSRNSSLLRLQLSPRGPPRGTRCCRCPHCSRLQEGTCWAVSFPPRPQAPQGAHLKAPRAKGPYVGGSLVSLRPHPKQGVTVPAFHPSKYWGDGSGAE